MVYNDKAKQRKTNTTMQTQKDRVINLIYQYIDGNEGGGYLTEPDDLYKRLSILMAKNVDLCDVSKCQYCRNQEAKNGAEYCDNCKEELKGN